MGRVIMAFGLPGSGKRTQVEKLCRVIEGRGHTCQVIEVGRRLRAIATQGSSVVTESLARVMREGRLVPEVFPLYVLAKEVIESPIADIVIVDGFGRRLPELKMVLRFFEVLGYETDAFLLDISTSEARKRLLSRGRQDDTPEAIDKRIHAYKRSTKVALCYLRRNKDRVWFCTVDGMGTTDVVHQRLLNCLCIDDDVGKKKTP